MELGIQTKVLYSCCGPIKNDETVFPVICQLILYKTIILPVLFYGAEAWALLSTDAPALTAFETKVLRKIFGSE